MDRQFTPIIVGFEDYEASGVWKPLLKVAETARKLSALFDAALPDRGTLMLHWIGHGVNAEGHHYLVCPSSPGPAELDVYSAVASAKTRATIARSRTQHILLILDACSSGEGAGDLGRRYRDNPATEPLPRGMGPRCLLVASGITGAIVNLTMGSVDD